MQHYNSAASLDGEVSLDFIGEMFSSCSESCDEDYSTRVKQENVIPQIHFRQET